MFSENCKLGFALLQLMGSSLWLASYVSINLAAEAQTVLWLRQLHGQFDKFFLFVTVFTYGLHCSVINTVYQRATQTRVQVASTVSRRIDKNRCQMADSDQESDFCCLN